MLAIRAHHSYVLLDENGMLYMSDDASQIKVPLYLLGVEL
jgi:hypothetical protein